MTIKTAMADCATEPFFLEWDEFYARHGLDPATDLITSSVWTVTGATKGVEFIDTPDTGVFLTPTVAAGQTILAENVIQINGGVYQDCRTLRIEVFS